MKSDSCANCGKPKCYKYIYPVDKQLQESWGTSDKLTALFNKREGSLCTSCGANIRAQGLAVAILKSEFGYNAQSLKEWVDIANKKELVVAEINSCHALHDNLKKLKRYAYAEYGTKSEQNIEELKCQSSFFDLVLHSETLEHVNNPVKAMAETRRVLKPGGLALFTIPVIWNRKTRRRARISRGQRRDLLAPSYHGKITDDYLVYYEYGSDVCSSLGVTTMYDSWKEHNYIFGSSKKPIAISEFKLLKHKLLESLSLVIRS